MNEGQKRRKRKREEEEKQEKEKWTKEQGWGRSLLLLVLLLFLAPRLRLRRSRPAGPPQRATRGPSRPGPRAGQPSTTPVGSRPGPRGGRLRRLPGRRREREQGKTTGTGLGVFFLGGCWGETSDESANEFFCFSPSPRPSLVCSFRSFRCSLSLSFSPRSTPNEKKLTAGTFRAADRAHN